MIFTYDVNLAVCDCCGKTVIRLPNSINGNDAVDKLNKKKPEHYDIVTTDKESKSLIELLTDRGWTVNQIFSQTYCSECKNKIIDAIAKIREEMEKQT